MKTKYLFLTVRCVCALSCVWFFATLGTECPWHLCPWNFSDKNTAVGCRFLFQGIFPTQGSNPYLLHLLHTGKLFTAWTIGEALSHNIKPALKYSFRKYWAFILFQVLSYWQRFWKKRTDQGPASRCLYPRRKIGNKQIKIYIGSGGVQWIKIKQSKGREKGKAIWNEVAIEELSKEAHMHRGLVDINKEAVSNLWVKFDELAACFCTAQRAKGLPRWC